MPDWKSVLTKTVHELEKQFDARRLRVEPADPSLRPLRVAPYRSFGTSKALRVRGRVLYDHPAAKGEASETIWRNLLETYRMLQTDEIEGARVRGQYGSATSEAVSDEEGFFEFDVRPEGPLDSSKLWHEVELDVLTPRVQKGDIAHVLVPSEKAEFGVISDLDDTVIKTEATHTLRMIKTVVTQSPKKRLPFAGGAAFYRALQLRGGSPLNPIFYVSSGPWNLYRLYADFLDLQKIPAGPILLSDFGISADKFIHSSHSVHKLLHIRTILDTYPELDFVLIGDSGQEDPEIYREVVRQYQDRILAIYIRDVTPEIRDNAVRGLGKELEGTGIDLLLVESTAIAARHAADRGWIPAEALTEIDRGI